jgi:hypothetical protein
MLPSQLRKDKGIGEMRWMILSSGLQRPAPLVLAKNTCLRSYESKLRGLISRRTRASLTLLGRGDSRIFRTSLIRQ